jgi:uncharacterized repeat protein (TIGR01451 family)
VPSRPKTRLAAALCTAAIVALGLVGVTVGAEAQVGATSAIYVTNETANTVSVVNPADNTLIATVHLGVNALPKGIAVTPDGSKVYVADSGTGTVSVIDTSTNTVLDTIPVGSQPIAVAVSPDGSEVYVANSNSTTVSVINTATNMVATVDVGFFGPQSVAFGPGPGGTTLAYVAGGTSVAVINTATDTLVKTIPVSSNFGLRGVAVSPDGSTVYATGGAGLSVINATTGAVTTTATGSTPIGVAVTPDGATVYVANSGSATVSAFNTATGAITTIPVGATPTSVAVSRDGSTVYVTNFGATTVSKISTATNTVTGTIPGFTTPYGVTAGPAERAAALTLSKLVSPTTVTSAGQDVTYKFEVTNSGSVSVDDIAIHETAFSGTGTLGPITCLATTLAPEMSTTCTATYTLTQADIDAGSVTNTAEATGTSSSGAVSSPPDSATVTVHQTPELALVKSVSPAAPSSFVVGQVITYTFQVTNTGNVTIHGAAIDETAFSGTGTMGPITCLATTLAPGVSTSCTATYTLTAADVAAGRVTNTAHATGIAPDGTAVTSPPDSAEAADTDVAALAVAKSATVSDHVIDYAFKVTNTGNVSDDDIAVHETAFSGSGTPGPITCLATTLAPADSTACTEIYTVTAADIAAGEVTDAAEATGTASTGAVTSPPDALAVPLEQTAALALSKTALPATVTHVGQVVTYSFAVTNTGDVPVTGIGIDEIAFSGTGTFAVITCPASPLAPGETTTCTTTYTVTLADAEAGKIVNTAEATGSNLTRSPVISPPSTATVTAHVGPSVPVTG